MGLGNWFRNEWWEAKEAGKEIKHFIKTHNWKKSARNSVRRKYWCELQLSYYANPPSVDGEIVPPPHLYQLEPLSSLPWQTVWWIVSILGCVAIGLIAYYRDTIVEKVRGNHVSFALFVFFDNELTLFPLFHSSVRTTQRRHCKFPGILHLPNFDPHHFIVPSFGRTRNRFISSRVNLGSLDRFRDRLRRNFCRRNVVLLLVQVFAE